MGTRVYGAFAQHEENEIEQVAHFMQQRHVEPGYLNYNAIALRTALCAARKLRKRGYLARMYDPHGFAVLRVVSAGRIISAPAIEDASNIFQTDEGVDALKQWLCSSAGLAYQAELVDTGDDPF